MWETLHPVMSAGKPTNRDLTRNANSSARYQQRFPLAAVVRRWLEQQHGQDNSSIFRVPEACILFSSCFITTCPSSWWQWSSDSPSEQLPAVLHEQLKWCSQLAQRQYDMLYAEKTVGSRRTRQQRSPFVTPKPAKRLHAVGSATPVSRSPSARPAADK